jgi:hypothetical protein
LASGKHRILEREAGDTMAHDERNEKIVIRSIWNRRCGAIFDTIAPGRGNRIVRSG